MGRINVARVALGGLAAGVVGNLLHWLIGAYLMTVEMTDTITRLGLKPDVVEGSMVTWIVVDFIWGFLLAFAYAAMRPRFGPGPTTAVISGITLWAAVCSVFAGLTAMGIYAEQAFIKESVLNLITAVASSVVAGAIYQEKA